MEIENVNFSSIQDRSEYLSEENEVVSHRSDATNSSSKAGWKRIRTETTTVNYCETPYQLKERAKQAFKEHRYQEALYLIEKIPQEVPGPPKVSLLLLKAVFLEMLERSEEALEQANQAIEQSNVVFDLKIQEMLKLGMPPESLITAQDHINAVIFMHRGFIQSSLNQKEQAILDFKKAIPTDFNHDKIFLFKVIEKKLGIQILPTEMEKSTASENLILQGKYEKALEHLLEQNEKNGASYYERTVCYAMLGQYDKALESYKTIDLYDPYYLEDHSEIPALIYMLKDDREMAKKEMDQWSDLNAMYHLLMKNI